MDWLKIRAGSHVLHWRESGDCGFDPATSFAEAASKATADGVASVIDANTIDWVAAPTVGPLTPLYIKLLHRDPKTGFYTRLIRAPKGWTDHCLAHHPCYAGALPLARRVVRRRHVSGRVGPAARATGLTVRRPRRRRSRPGSPARGRPRRAP